MPAIREVFCKLANCNVYSFHLWKRRFNTSIFNATPKKTIEEKLGIPRRPKRPPTAFMIFANERRPALIQQNPDKKPSELIKIMSEEWKNLENNKKEELQDKFRKDWQKYLEETKNYDESLSPGEKERIKIEKEEAKILQAKKYIKKKRSELGCPKKPGSSYMYFMRTKLPERQNESFVEFQQKLKKQWEDLPASEKKKFEEMYKKDMEEYREKMAEWNKQMLAMGNKDVAFEKPSSSRLNSHDGCTIISSSKEPDMDLDRKKSLINIMKFINEFSNKEIAYLLFSSSLVVICLYFYIFIFID